MTRLELIARTLWLALRRAPRDRRALTFVAAWLGLLFYVLYLGGSFYYLGFWGSLATVGIMALGAGVAILIGRANRHADSSLLKLSAPAPTAAPELSQHRRILAAALLRAAILVDRAGVEALYRNNKVPAPQQGICRRRTLDLAMRPELWDGFTPAEQDLLRSQEGAWEWDAVWPRVLRVEDVRTLRWVIGIDPVLTPFEFLKPDLTPALEITLKPERAEGHACMNSWDLRPARDMAGAMLTRCLGEGIERGFFQLPESKGRDDLIQLSERMAADPGSDLLIGAATVASAGVEQVRWVAQAAERRMRVLTAAIDFLGGPADSPFALPG